MTISSTTTKNSYSGNGSTTAFAYTFFIPTSSDIQVIERSSAGVETVKSEGTGSTNYSISGVGNSSGGTVTMVTAPASGTTLVLRRSTTQTQTTDYVANDPFPAETHEAALDKLTIIAQDLQEEMDRSFKVSRTNTITSSTFTTSATERANKAVGFDSSGDLTVLSDFNPAGGDSALFQYSTTTTDSDPGGGYLRFNNSSPASATILYVDDLEYNETDVSAWVQSFDDVSANPTNRGRVRVHKSTDLSVWNVYRVTGAVTDASGYTKIPLAYVDGAGSLANDDKVFLSFTPSGEDGVSAGYYYKFDSGTSDADPGAGEISFNNGTYSSVTQIYIDDADQHGATTQTDTITWDDSTAGTKGFIQIVDIDDKSTYAKFKVTGTATDASGYNKLTVEHVVSNNTFSAADNLSVHFTASGNDGAIPGYAYNFDTSTTDADPGAGDIRFNNGTYASATAIYIDDVDANGVTTSTDVLTWDDSTSTIKGYLHIVDTNDPTTYARFSITGSSTDGSGYNKLAVTHLASNNTFSAADNLSVHFTRQGDKGDTGSTGSTGSTGAAGVAGIAMTWNSSTSDADPGAGKIAFNNGTVSSVSILYVDDADDASADISGWVQSWDDVSNSVARGYVKVEKEGTPATYALFKVSGAVTDASGYTKVPVTHVVSAGSFSNTDGVGVHFINSGADSAVTASSTTTFTNKTHTAPKIADGGYIADANGNELVIFQTTSSAVNQLEITNAAAGNNPILAATGGDTNIGINLTPKGTGEVVIAAGNLNYGSTAITSSGAELNYSDLTTLGTTAASKVFTADANNLTKITGGVYLEEATLTFDATQDWDVRASPVAKVTLTNNVTFDAPTNPTTGQYISIVCIQDGTGSRTIAWNAVFEFKDDTAPTATTTASKGDMFTFRYNGSKWLEVGRNLNLTLS